MKKNFTTILLCVVLFVGLFLLLYPSVSDWYNSYHQSKVVASFAQSVSEVNDEEYRRMIEDAQAHNEKLAEKNRGAENLSTKEKEEYDSLLDITGTGVMGYIDIQKIRCTLPIYHGTDDSVLQVAIGHLPWSSLPIGGEGTHCVLSGHRGLPSARLFTDIDQLVEGDTFIIRTMNETLTYEVEQINIVLPEDTHDLYIVSGEDLCTLVTCTPYGVNTHRLLVRAHRTETRPGYVNVTTEAIQVKPVIMMPILAAPMLLLLTIWAFASNGNSKGRRIMERHRTERNENSLAK